jgi:deoxyribonuclease-4
MPQLKFGTAGVPESAQGSDPASGVEAVAKSGLSAMELEFVYGVRIRDEMIEKVREKAEEHSITLTCHAPYYINLNAKEKEKREASIVRILDTARVAHKVGAFSITFHAAFYLKEEPEKVHQVVKQALMRIRDTLDKEKINVQIRPELTGKPSQYGDLEEILLLSSEIEGVFPCVDFSHLFARTNGQYNSIKEQEEVWKRYRQVLGRKAMSNLHLHLSGIEYTPKGERRHLMLKKSKLRYLDILEILKKNKASGVLICESPNPEKDALFLQRTYQQI